MFMGLDVRGAGLDALICLRASARIQDVAERIPRDGRDGASCRHAQTISAVNGLGGVTPEPA